MLLPAGLIVVVVIGWRLGANAVLSFWLAYILTRPLGANLGDWLGFPPDQQGLGLGTAITSVIFLIAILATVVYLTVTHSDVIEKPETTENHHCIKESGSRTANARVLRRRRHGRPARLGRRAAALHRSGQRSGIRLVGHCDLAPGQSATANFPPAEVTKFRTIVQDTLAKVHAGDQTGATTRIKDLETAWDDQPCSP